MAEDTTGDTTFTPPPPKEEKKAKKGKIKKSEPTDVDFEVVNNDKTTTPNVQTEEVDLKQLKDEIKSEKVTIDFMNNDYINEDVKKQTKKSEAPVDEVKNVGEHKTIADVQQEIKDLEDEKNKELKPKDYEEIASLVINIIDFLMSALLKWWGKDSSDAAYSLNEQKKKVLVNQLSLILIKHQQKWSIEFLFILTLIAVYSGPVMAAQANRKNPSDRKPGRPAKK